MRVQIFVGAFVLIASSSGCSQTDSGARHLDRERTASRSTQEVTTATEGRPSGVPEKIVLGAPELLDGIRGDGPLTIEEIRQWLEDPRTNVPLDFELPLWLKPGAGQVKDLKNNPMTRA
jgi:hypothetical protein